jgi:hypothetical protein
MKSRLCEWCSKLYTPRQHNQRFCSKPCNIAWNQDAALKGREFLRQVNQTEPTPEPVKE